MLLINKARWTQPGMLSSSPSPYFSRLVGALTRTGCKLCFAFAFIFDWFLPIASCVISINYDSLLILVAQHLNVQQDLAGSYVQYTIYIYDTICDNAVDLLAAQLACKSMHVALLVPASSHSLRCVCVCGRDLAILQLCKQHAQLFS